MATMRTLRTASGAALAAALLFASAPHATADQVRDDQWALNALQAKSVWQMTKGKGQVIAVIDGGVDANHPDLRGNVLEGKDFMDGGSTAPEGGNDHGTSMAADIAGHGHGPGHRDGVSGLAPEAKILSIRDRGQSPTGFAASIRFAVDHGATVVNISQGGNDPAGKAMEKAIGYALLHNVVIVAGTGNEGGPVAYPAAYAGVVAVSGVAKDGSFWTDSNRGEETLLSAPAERIVSAGDSKSGYTIADGTSDATAYTSAAVALLKSKFPDLSAGQIVNRLTKTAVVPGSTQHAEQRDERWGYGAIRPLAALTADIPKGSKWGPLTVPAAVKKKAEAAEAQKKREQAEIAKGQEKADQKAVIIWSVIGGIALVLIVVVVLVIVMVRRKKNRNNGPGGPGGPGAYGGYPYPSTVQPQGYGAYPPHQQQPMPPQPSAPPQHPPYNN